MSKTIVSILINVSLQLKDQITNIKRTNSHTQTLTSFLNSLLKQKYSGFGIRFETVALWYSLGGMAKPSKTKHRQCGPNVRGSINEVDYTHLCY